MSPESDTASLSPPFGESYAKARKAYGLSSALLLAWEFVGIGISANPVDTLKISLKSPQAAPYVLIALVAYFAVHFTIEWYQTAETRRRLRASRVDFAIAHCLGIASIALFGVQSLLRIQIADALPGIPNPYLSFGGLSFILGVSCFWGLRSAVRRWRHGDRRFSRLALPIGVAFMTAFLVSLVHLVIRAGPFSMIHFFSAGFLLTTVVSALLQMVAALERDFGSRSVD